MARLRHEKLRHFAAATVELAQTAPEGVSSSNFLLGAVARLIPLDRVSYNEVERAPGGRLITAHSWNEVPDASLISGLNRFMHEHPGFAKTDPADPYPRPTLISDHLSQRQFRQLGLYQDHFRLYGIHHQLGVSFVVSPDRRISFGLNRQRRDFSEEDRLMIGLFRPHLAAAWRREQVTAQVASALAMRDAALAGTSAAVVLLDALGEVMFSSELATELTARFGIGTQFLAWARRLMGEESPAQARMEVERDGNRLVAVFTRAPRAGGWHLLRLTERSAAPSARPLEALGLARREAEALFWLARGKRNAEIAVICGMRLATVGAHLRTVFSKLGVETRTAAAAMAWETLVE